MNQGARSAFAQKLSLLVTERAGVPVTEAGVVTVRNAEQARLRTIHGNASVNDPP